jgi:hypothetical protein
MVEPVDRGAARSDDGEDAYAVGRTAGRSRMCSSASRTRGRRRLVWVRVGTCGGSCRVGGRSPTRRADPEPCQAAAPTWLLLGSGSERTARIDRAGLVRAYQSGESLTAWA